jgi:hypothetical protein
MPDQIRTIRVRNRKTGEEIEVPFDAIVKDPRVKLPANLLGSSQGTPNAIQEDKNLNLQQLVEEATRGLPPTTFQERFPNAGRDATNALSIGTGLAAAGATGGSSVPIQVLTSFLANLGTQTAGKYAGEAAGFDMPTNTENVVSSVLGEGLGLGLRGGVRAGSEAINLIKTARGADPTKVNSGFLKWFANYLQPKLEGTKKPLRQPIEPALPDVDTNGELSAGQWLSEKTVLDEWKKNNYPLLTSQANSNDLAARLEAMNPKLPEILQKQNLKMQEMAGNVAPINLYETAAQRGARWEPEVKLGIDELKLDPSIPTGDIKNIVRSKTGKVVGKPSGEGKPGSPQALKSPEQAVEVPLESEAEFGRFMTTVGREKSSQFLREELLTRAFDTTSGAFDASSARTFIKEHTGKFMKALSSEERHAVNKFIASLDMQQRRLQSLSYTPAAQASGGRQFQALVGAAAVTGPKGLTSMVAGRQAAALGTILFERKALAKLMANPKFAYAASGLMEMPGGIPGTKGKLRTMLQAAAKAGVNFKLLRLDGVEQTVSSNERGDLVFPGNQEFSLDNFYPRQEE